MAQSEEGVPNGTDFMDLSCSDSGPGIEENLDIMTSALKNTTTDESDEIDKYPVADLHVTEDEIQRIDEEKSCKASDDAQCLSENIFAKSTEENQEKNVIELCENKARCVDRQTQESNNCTDTYGVTRDDDEMCDIKFIDAVSLTDIKASFANNQEEIEGNSVKTVDDGNRNDVNSIDLENQAENNILSIDTSICPDVTHDAKASIINSANSDATEGKGVDNNDSSKSNDNTGMEFVAGNREKKVISNYEIHPGELTNRLIEGPSITLPLSEISNRNSSAICDNELSASKIDKPSILPEPMKVESLSLSSNSKIDLSSVSISQEPPPSMSQEDVPTTSASSSSGLVSLLADISTASMASNGEQQSLSSPNSNVTITSNESVNVCTTTTTKTSISTTSTPAPAKRMKKTPDDFIFGKVLGEGSYSSVYLAKEVSTQREFAVKVCEKKHLIREKKTHFVMREKEVLMKLDHPFFIRLAYTFQDAERLYYVLTYARNGELLSYLNKLSVFDVPCTRFYSAEVVVALEYLQSLGIVHRDIKPENILLGEDMHIKISDFGTSKFINGAPEENRQSSGKRKNSFVGTAEYVSPEVLNGQPANYGTDLWALACIIYQCLSSCLPFRSVNEYQTFQKILKLDYEFPEGFHEDAKDLVQKILVLEPTDRLGMRQPGGMEELKQHPFFQGIEWSNLPTTTPPKLLPYLPASANNPEFWGEQEHRTGFDDQRLAEIITGQSERSTSPELEPVSVKGRNELADMEWKEKLEKQRQENQFHQFVENNLILRQGFVDKRKGFFARKRMLLLTEGPHLYYVDAHNKVLKGEIPWSRELRAEAKNFKIFFVHTPNRTYYLESRHPDAHLWVKRIQDVWNKYYGHDNDNGDNKRS